MTYKVKMTDEAASQLQDTAQYILRLSGSPSVSRKWMEKLQKAINSLVTVQSPQLRFTHMLLWQNKRKFS